MEGVYRTKHAVVRTHGQEQTKQVGRPQAFFLPWTLHGQRELCHQNTCHGHLNPLSRDGAGRAQYLQTPTCGIRQKANIPQQSSNTS